MANKPKTLTTMDGEKVTMTPFDIKAVRNIDKGVEVDTHAGGTYKFPVPRYVFDLMFTIDLRGTGNSVEVIDPIR
jgi:hypothetical protein